MNGRAGTTGPSWSRLLGWLVPLAVLAATAAVAVGAHRVERSRHDDEVQRRFALVDDDIHDQLQSLLDREVLGAQATAAALSVDPELDRAAFVQFAERLRSQAPTVLGIGYVRQVAAADVAAFTRTVRSRGVPGFQVEDPGSRPSVAAIVYNEPADELAGSWGADVARVPAAAEALAQARDTGRPAVSARVVLVVDRDLPPARQPAGFVAYAPVYAPGAPTDTVEQRRAALVGWSNVPFRGQDVVDRLRLPAGVAMQFHDATGGSPAGTRGAVPGSAPDGTLALRVGAATWTAHVWTLPAFAADVPDRAGAVATVTAAVGVLLAGLVALLANGSRRWSAAATRATAELARSESQLRATITAAPDLILVVDAGGTVLSASARADDLLALDPASLPGRPADEVLPGWEPSRAAGDGAVELAALRADGAQVPVEVSVSRLRPDEPGSPVVAIVRDVTARRRQEADRALLSSIVTSTDDGVITVSPEGLITSWNGGAERMYGWSAADALGRPLAWLAGDGDDGLTQEEPPFQRPVLHRRRDGATIHASVTASRLPSGLGQPGGISLIVRDVTTDVRSREALAAYAAELERSNRELDELASIASHDLSEPLRVVGGYVTLLQHRYTPGRPIDGAALEYLEAINGGVVRMRELIDGLLAVARLRSEQGRMEAVPLAEVARTVVADLGEAIRESGAAVQVGDLPVVLGNRVLLTQLLQNLVANAVRFRHPDRAPAVEVRAEPVAGGAWRIVVEDNGIGISPAHRERVFRMFSRLHPADRYPGTGIGLAVARRVADAHGTELVVDARPGGGSSFSFTLREVVPLALPATGAREEVG